VNDTLLERIRNLTPQMLRGGGGVEDELLQLRLAAGQELMASCRESVVSLPPVADLFSDVVGLPEITGEELHADTLAAGVRHRGALLVRGLFSQRQLERLEQLAQTQEVANQGDTGVLGCSTPTLFELLDIYRECGLLRVVSDYLLRAADVR
jgi:hypothetical protein